MADYVSQAKDQATAALSALKVGQDAKAALTEARQLLQQAAKAGRHGSG